ncbi:MAG: hypothetical protein CR975_06805 [Gammaproteobacteria bacterium]|nr:MAG: hypothetical protein CR975_06805 [Gammaproteobacteria bacterium]
MTNKPDYIQDYPINTTLLDTNQALSLTGLLNLLQDVGAEHADILNAGNDFCIQNNVFWVFTQQRLRIERIPVYKEVLTIKTWLRNIGGISSVRDYALFVGDEQIASGCSQFLLLDGKTHRPQRLSRFADLLPEHSIEPNDFDTRKIVLPETMNAVQEHTVTTGDLDHNQHVNNTKYTQWVLDSLPLEQQQKQVCEYETNFIAQTFLGDKVLCYSDFATDSPADTNTDSLSDTIHFKVNNADTDKTLFTSRIVYR